MKVLLAWNGPATLAERDPIARRAVPLLSTLVQQGVAPVLVLLGDPTGMRALLADTGVAVEVLPHALPPTAGALSRLPLVVPSLRRVIQRHRPDIVEGDEPMPAIAAGLAARGSGALVIYRRHHADGRRRLILASRLAARLAARTIVSNAAMRDAAAEQDHTPVDRIEIASSGMVDDPGAAPGSVEALRTSLFLDGSSRLIVAVSRLRREKGLDVLIDALTHLRDLHDVRCAILGEGPEDAALRARAAAQAVAVHFAGHQADVAPWYAAASVVAIPSRRESFGRVPLEAMAAARPVVATRVGGLAQAIADEDTGLLVPPDDPLALAAALRRVLTDPALALRLGSVARRHFEQHYTIDHMAHSWRACWARALHSGLRP